MLVNEYVCRLQITMHYTFLVHVLQSTSYLMYVFPDLFLGERDVFLDSFLDDQLQVSLFSPLDRDEEFIQLIIYEPIQVLDDVRMV
jgi:hypothetical protein